MGDCEKAAEYYQNALNIEFDIYAVLGLAVIARQQESTMKRLPPRSLLSERSEKLPHLYRACSDLSHEQPAQQAIEVLTEFQQMGIKNPVIQEALSKLSGKA
jgi:hypothetical protein